VNEELAARHAQALDETLGYSGRMISFSKTLYREAHPDRAAVFNANVCLAAGKIWHGDLDLTEDEPKLLELARQVDETVYVLYESAARFETEDEPLLGDALYSVAPSGHTRFEFRYLERRPDGTLGHRPPEPDRRPRWRWRVLLHRPRLLRFWQTELKRSRDRVWPPGETTTTLLYVGARDQGVTPLLVLGATRTERLRRLGLELTWYPAKPPSGRANAPRALIDLTPTLRLAGCASGCGFSSGRVSRTSSSPGTAGGLMAERCRAGSDASSEPRIRHLEMLVARYRAAEHALVVAFGENLSIGAEQAELVVRTLIEVTIESQARGAGGNERVYLNQPVCERCWRALHPSRVAVRAASAVREETCAFCGFQTSAGIYTREHPDRVPYPKSAPSDEEDEPPARRRK
jgi:hypothetical protein